MLVASRRFQPGERPCRGLLRDYEPSWGTLFEALLPELVLTAGVQAGGGGVHGAGEGGAGVRAAGHRAAAAARPPAARRGRRLPRPVQLQQRAVSSDHSEHSYTSTPGLIAFELFAFHGNTFRIK